MGCGLLIAAAWLMRPGAAQAQDSLQQTLPDSTQALPPSDAAAATDTALLPALPTAAFLDSIRHIHSPTRAAFYSAVLPGLGQAYNHQYIKIPLMWAGLGVATGIFIFNFDHYVTFRDAYRLRLNGKMTGDPRVDVYSPENLRYIRDGYRQYVDYSVLGFAAAYLYNILDAIVFAHLYHFDVSDDLGPRFGPVLRQRDGYVGFGLSYTF